jgi:CheY-like chemotaxis protein
MTNAFDVLIVENCDDTRFLLHRIFQRLVHQVVAVGNGPDALDAVASFTPDVAFIDLAMPGMSGLELVKQLRADPALRRTRLVAHSGLASRDYRQAALAAGFDAFIPKPAPPDQLLAALR